MRASLATVVRGAARQAHRPPGSRRRQRSAQFLYQSKQQDELPPACPLDAICWRRMRVGSLRIGDYPPRVNEAHTTFETEQYDDYSDLSNGSVERSVCFAQVNKSHGIHTTDSKSIHAQACPFPRGFQQSTSLIEEEKMFQDKARLNRT